MKQYITTYQGFLEYWQKLQDKVPLAITYAEVRCKFCDSRNVVRYGYFKEIQRWWCKDCHRKFADNSATPYMKTHNDKISVALVMYYEGMSLHAIRRQLGLHYHIYPSESTVHEWIGKYTNIAINSTKKYTPNVGDVWLADETILKIAGKNVCLWDIIDVKTRYLLASYIATKRTIKDAQIIMERAAQEAGKLPRRVLTNKLAAYLDGIQVTLGVDTKYVAAKDLAAKQNNKFIERFQDALKKRTQVMESLKNNKNAELILNGFVIHYNYFQSHEGLQNRTPAELAGIYKCLDRNWSIAVERAKELNETLAKEL